MATELDENQPLAGLSAMVANRLALKDSNPQLYAELEARMPLVSAHPNVAAEMQGQVSPDQVQQAMQTVGAAPAAAPTATAPAPTAPAAPTGRSPQSEAIYTVLSKVMEDFNKEKPKLYGPDLMGQKEGILGSGMSPTSALLFALGGLLFRKMPQEKAWAMSLKLAGLPGEFEKGKSEMLQQKVQTILGTANAATAVGNLEARNTELAAAATKTVQQEAWRRTITPDQTDLTPQQKLHGVSVGALPASVLQEATQFVEGTDGIQLRSKVTGQAIGPLIPKEKKAERSQLDVRTRTILAGAAESGTPMTINQARKQAHDEELALSKEKIAAGAQSRQSVEAVKRIDALIDADTQVRAIFRLADTLITAKTPGQATLDSLTLGGQALISGTNPGVYKATTEAMAGTLARSLGGERGVLTDRDIDRIVSMFPTFSDTVATKEFKRARLELFLDSGFRRQQAIIDGEKIDFIAERKKNSLAIDKMIADLAKFQKGGQKAPSIPAPPKGTTVVTE